MAVNVRAITRADLPAVGQFLHDELNQRVTAADWAAAPLTGWAGDAPNHGFLLAAEERIVGVYLAFYSTRTIDGVDSPICNLGAWCVHPDYRLHSVRLLKAMLEQRGYTFTDLSPSGSVVPLNERMKFVHLDTATALMPALPYPTRPGRIRLTAAPERIEAALTGSDLDLYRDHRHAPAAHFLLATSTDRSTSEHCLLAFRKDRRKNLPIFASLLYVSNPSLFASAARVLARRLLIRQGILALLIELRVAGGRPKPTIMLSTPRPKMFRSATLSESNIDYLYSELVSVAW